MRNPCTSLTRDTIRYLKHREKNLLAVIAVLIVVLVVLFKHK